MLGIPEPELRRKLAGARQKLLEVRSRRVWPGRDEKALAMPVPTGTLISGSAAPACGARAVAP